MSASCFRATSVNSQHNPVAQLRCRSLSSSNALPSILLPCIRKEHRERLKELAERAPLCGSSKPQWPQWWQKNSFLSYHGRLTSCHAITGIEAEHAGNGGRGGRRAEEDKKTTSSANVSKRAEKNNASWRLGGVLDIYILRSTLPAFVMALALCAFLGMSLGALVELIREVVSAGKGSTIAPS